MSFQRKTLSTGADVGAPGPLPAELVGLTPEVLADLPAHLDAGAVEQLGYADTGFVVVTDPPPPPPRVVSHYDFLSRFTTAERVAIRASADATVADLMEMMREAQAVDLDAPATQQGVHYLASVALIASDRPAVLLA